MFLVFVWAAPVNGQDIESMRREFERFKADQERSMSDYKERNKRSMDSLRDAANRAFAAFLKETWEYKKTLRNDPPYQKPKPEDPPRIPGSDTPVNPVVPAPPKRNDPKPEDPAPPKPSPAGSNLARLAEREYGAALTLRPHTYYGQDTRLPDLRSSWPKINRPVREESVTEYWNACTKVIQQKHVDILNLHRVALDLNDWAFQDLVRQWGEMNFSNATDRELFIWFMLIQHEYDVRLFYYQDAINLGYRMNRILYGLPYFEVEGKNYSIIRSATNQVYTYPKQHGIAKKEFKLERISATGLQGETAFRAFRFKHQNNDVVINLPYDRNRLLLFKELPQTELQFYLGEPGHPDFLAALHQQVDPYLRNLTSDVAKVRFLHAMVTYSIPYQTDEEQFGREKFCLPEETLAYPYADCEDRANLLGLLVRELTGLKVASLHYPGHLALAVEIPGAPADMYRLNHNGRQYVYCDPTYFGADIGMIPASYRNVTPVMYTP